MLLDLISSLGGLIISPLYDFVKKKFLPPANDTPEATLSSLAVTKPEMLGQFSQGYAALLQAKKDYFNRDVIGAPSSWVVDLRAVIRPAVVVAGLIIIFSSICFHLNLPTGVREFFEINISSWFGCRISR